MEPRLVKFLDVWVNLFIQDPRGYLMGLGDGHYKKEARISICMKKRL